MIKQENISIKFKVKRNPIKFHDLHYSIGEKTVFRTFRKEGNRLRSEFVIFPELLTNGSLNQRKISDISHFIYDLNRDISEDITNLPMKQMPGFKFSWTYDPRIESQAYYNISSTSLYNYEFIK